MDWNEGQIGILWFEGIENSQMSITYPPNTIVFAKKMDIGTDLAWKGNNDCFDFNMGW